MLRDKLDWVDVSFVRGKFKLSAPIYGNEAYEITFDDDNGVYKIGIYGDDNNITFPIGFAVLADAKEFCEDDYAKYAKLLLDRGIE